MILVEMHNIPDARQRLEDLKKAVASLTEVPPDGYEFDVQVSIPVMARHADLMVTIKEGKTLEALRLLEDLVSRYPKQLSIPEFRNAFQEVTTWHGMLLAEAGRWEEA